MILVGKISNFKVLKVIFFSGVAQNRHDIFRKSAKEIFAEVFIKKAVSQ
jgi:hypothetical protein